MTVIRGMAEDAHLTSSWIAFLNVVETALNVRHVVLSVEAWMYDV